MIFRAIGICSLWLVLILLAVAVPEVSYAAKGEQTKEAPATKKAKIAPAPPIPIVQVPATPIPNVSLSTNWSNFLAITIIFVALGSFTFGLSVGYILFRYLELKKLHSQAENTAAKAHQDLQDVTYKILSKISHNSSNINNTLVTTTENILRIETELNSAFAELKDLAQRKTCQYNSSDKHTRAGRSSRDVPDSRPDIRPDKRVDQSNVTYQHVSPFRQLTTPPTLVISNPTSNVTLVNNPSLPSTSVEEQQQLKSLLVDYNNILASPEWANVQQFCSTYAVRSAIRGETNTQGQVILEFTVDDAEDALFWIVSRNHSKDYYYVLPGINIRWNISGYIADASRLAEDTFDGIMTMVNGQNFELQQPGIAKIQITSSRDILVVTQKGKINWQM